VKRFMCVADRDGRPDGHLLTDDLNEAAKWVEEKGDGYEREWSGTGGGESSTLPRMTANELWWQLIVYRDPNGYHAV
jgi:hypothetical protein